MLTLVDLSNTGDRLWAIGNEIYYFDGQAWKADVQLQQVLQNPCPPTSLSKSRDGSLWFWGCGQVIRFDGRNWQNYNNLQGSQVVTLLDGTLLFVMGESDLIVSFDGNRFQSLVLPGSDHEYPIQNYLSTPSGDLWLQIASSYRGDAKSAYLIHNGQIQPTSALDLNNAPDQSLDAPVVMTPNGWVFDDDENVYIYNGKDWKALAPIIEPPISTLVNNGIIGFSPDGALWMVQGADLVRFGGDKVESPFKEHLAASPDSGCDANYHYQLDSRGSIWSWAPDSPELCYYDPGTKKVIPFKLLFNVSQLAVAPDGSIWAALSAGFLANLTLNALESGDYRKIELIKIGGDLVQFALSPARIEVGADGAVWVFITNAGLYRYNGKGWKYLGLSNLQFSSAFAIDASGHVWAGFCNGLQKYDGEKWVQYPHNCVWPTNLTVAPDGAVWFVSSGNGVYRFDGNQWTQFTAEQLGGFIPYQIIVAPDSALWFIGDHAWARYKP